MAAQVALGEVEVTNVEEVAEGRVRGLADARSVDVSRALAAAADRTNVGGMSFLLNIEMQKANMNLGYLSSGDSDGQRSRVQERSAQRLSGLHAGQASFYCAICAEGQLCGAGQQVGRTVVARGGQFAGCAEGRLASIRQVH